MHDDQVFERLKPKAKSLGFSANELKTVAGSIAKRLNLKDDATEEEVNAAIDAEIDAVIPFLQISQSAANRIVEANRKNSKEGQNEPTGREGKEGNNPKPNDDDDNVPKWAKSLMEQNKSLLTRIDSLEKEKSQETYAKSVREALKGISPKFYERSLSKQSFNTQEEADAFVSEVKEDYEAFAKEAHIQGLGDMKPPKGGTNPNPNEASPEAKALADKRKAEAEKAKAPIYGGGDQKLV